jgi:uncharacterized RDD family membrane protein YckC
MTPSTPPAAPQTLLGHYAGFTSRLLAFVIDSVIIGVTLLSLTWLVSVMTSMLQVRMILGFSLQAVVGADRFLDILFGPAVTSVFTFLYILVYYVFFLVVAGQTPGKALMGLRVVSINGRRLTYLQAILRVIGYVISAFFLFLGFLWIFVDDRRQAWHDKLARTCVIYTWAARPDERFLAEEIKQLEENDERHLLQPGK